jgi:hypothetical protein
MDADELVGKTLAAAGGVDNIKAVKTSTITGKVMSQGMEIPLQIVRKRPDKIRVSATVQGMEIVQCYAGGSGYSINPMTGSSDPQPMGDVELMSFKLQGDLDGLLVDFKKKGFTVEYLGEVDVAGTPTYQLRVDTKQGIVIDQFIDQENFHIIKKTNKLQVDDNEMVTDTFQSDFREVDGITMPFAIETRQGDFVVNQIQFESVEHNLEIDDALFAMKETGPGAPGVPVRE